MAWNHKSRVVSMAVKIQEGQGQFAQPNRTTDLVAVSAPTNTHDPVTADDATSTGAIWESNRVYLGKTATLGGTIPLRGPGGVAPPAASAWTPGRILQSAGWAEIRSANPIEGDLVDTGNSFRLLIEDSGQVENLLLGAPFQYDFFGAGFKRTTMLTRSEVLGDIVEVAESAFGIEVGEAYVIPPYLSYQLGTLTGAPVYLSVSIWRDKKRYDYVDFQPTSLVINLPVSNEANTNVSDITFQGKALVQAIADDTAPVLPSSLLAIQPAPVRNGKFFLNRVRLGHQQLSFTETLTVAGASNQNAAAGQDGYDIISGTRQIALDLNQMAVADFDLHDLEDNQTKMPLMSTWGAGQGNNFGFIVPNLCLDPFTPADRNGFVSITGNAYSTDVDKSAALTIWW